MHFNYLYVIKLIEMKKIFVILIGGAILFELVALLASTISSCFFFITTFTLIDFEERTTSFILGVVSSLFTYGMFRAFANSIDIISDKFGIKNKNQA